MREILFRGKRIDNGEWVEGYLILKDDQAFIASYPYFTGKIHETSWLEFCFGGFIGVIPETVGQYTGLTDKNGKKIFEGDIILVDFDGFPIYKREISFNQDVSAYVLWNGTKSKFYPMSEAPKKYSKVIGNIHDNPELLEVEK